MDYFIEFNHRLILIDCPLKGVSKGIEQLFKDLFLSGEKEIPLVASYKVYEDDGFMGIMKDGKYIYTQKSDNEIEIVNVLMNEMKLDFLKTIHDSMVLHAALVSFSGKSILLPGNSGNGKSLTTLGLLSLGCKYHTDEVVLYDSENEGITPFVRPLMIKHHGVAAAQSLLGNKMDDFILLGETMNSLPIDSLYEHFGSDTICGGSGSNSLNSVEQCSYSLHNPPPIKVIAFPHYDKNSAGELISLSPAKTVMELFKNNVVGRNLPNLGMHSLKCLAERACGIKLNYSNYEQLPSLFDEIQLLMSQ